eukprot:CAMPEP_0118921038 /NCGR_PEP_ID=MMETSP1169-20130426/436_1 /TAXON_ID=36882 /ORGANISM="Pyramimonas obovata, Strain CCMP722" /LENGTH=134 /DNA_ID=CAMNT_0006861687 /DNA_START=181 /DNA_END=582 /DNA_ORIENTATION=-
MSRMLKHIGSSKAEPKDPKDAHKSRSSLKSWTKSLFSGNLRWKSSSPTHHEEKSDRRQAIKASQSAKDLHRSHSSDRSCSRDLASGQPTVSEAIAKLRLDHKINLGQTIQPGTLPRRPASKENREDWEADAEAG